MALHGADLEGNSFIQVETVKHSFNLNLSQGQKRSLPALRNFTCFSLDHHFICLQPHRLSRKGGGGLILGTCDKDSGLFTGSPVSRDGLDPWKEL